MAEDLDETLVPSPRAPTEPPAASGPDLEKTLVTDPPRARPVRPPVTKPLPPQFFQFRVGSRTEPIALDRPCFVGRRPSSPRIIRGAAPRLLRVPSPLKEVSATHIEVRQLGSSVIVTDLRSTNGSVVMVPGSVPRKLRQGESVVVSPGTLVDIGDDNVLHILPMTRLIAEDAGVEL
ncbi:MAG: FHA domain-containing protein [Pseudolysinimonas sp.]